MGFIPLARLIKAHFTGIPDVMPDIAPKRSIPDIPADHEQYLVEFCGPDDPLRPVNWSKWQKGFHMFMSCYAGMAVMWGMAIWGSAEKFLKPIYHLDWSVSGLGISLYIIAVMSGPAFWVPFSDLHGRRPLLVISMLGAMSFAWWTSTGAYYYQLLLYRFITGLFGAGSVSIVGEVFKDLSDSPGAVDTAISVYTIMIFGAPTFAPWVSDCIGFSFLGWRWMFTLSGIMMSVAFVLFLCFFEETKESKILQSKARELRIRSGNRFIYAPDDHNVLDFSIILHNFIAGPVKFLVADPTLFVVSIYQGFLFSLNYLAQEGIPFTFERYGWEKDLKAIASLSMALGMAVACAVQIFITNPMYRKSLLKTGAVDSAPLRLWVMLPGAILLPTSIFWWFWTGYYRVHWVSPLIATWFTGYGLVTAFAPALNFVYVSYTVRPEIALATSSVIRAMMMGVCPLFSKSMYFTLDVQWSGTLLGCLAVVLGSLPYIIFWLIPLFGVKNSKCETKEEYRRSRWERIMRNQIVKYPLTQVDADISPVQTETATSTSTDTTQT